jgi:hypothetical protein
MAEPLTFQCPYCNKTILEGEEWGYGYDGEEEPCHDACSEERERKRNEEQTAYINALKAKKRSELSYWEMVSVDVYDSQQSLVDLITDDTNRWWSP